MFPSWATTPYPTGTAANPRRQQENFSIIPSPSTGKARWGEEGHWARAGRSTPFNSSLDIGSKRFLSPLREAPFIGRPAPWSPLLPFHGRYRLLRRGSLSGCPSYIQNCRSCRTSLSSLVRSHFRAVPPTVLLFPPRRLHSFPRQCQRPY